MIAISDYTGKDVRTEAARQHSELTTDPDFMGVGEALETNKVPSTEASGAPRTWDEALREHADDYGEFDKVQRQVHDLIIGAADVSQWAIDDGADGLEPDGAVTVDSSGGRPMVRLHFAFHPEIPQDFREKFSTRISDAIAGMASTRIRIVRDDTASSAD